MNKRDKDRLILLSVKVAALREQLQEAESEWEELIAQQQNNHAEPPEKGSSAAEEEWPPTMAERIVGLLAKSSGPMDAKSVQERLNIENLQSVRSTLARLARDGAISSPERGQYESLK